MTGRRLKSFRKGDWNEELGVLLLKALAAVAPIPRQEDFGLDAVATLLRPDPKSRCLYAEESFWVQFKSESGKPLLYKGQELEWLKNLQLPFFIGEVRRRDSTLRLFGAHKLNEIFVLRDFKELMIRLQDQGKAKRHVDRERCEVFLGKPILSFNMEQASDDRFVDHAYRMLQDYLRLEQQNVNSRSLRFCRHIRWTTNRRVYSPDGELVALRKASAKDDLHGACQSLVPGLQVISLYAKSTEDRVLKKRLRELVRHLRTILTTPEALDESGDAYQEWDDPMPFLD
jgi:hypothetical protein